MANDQIHYQILSLMWVYDHNTLPSSLTECFIRSSSSIHHYTRGGLRGDLYHTQVNTLKYQGIHVLNDLKKLDIINIFFCQFVTSSYCSLPESALGMLFIFPIGSCP